MYFEHMKRYIFILLLLTFVLSSPAHSADTEYIGIIPFYAPEKMWTLYLPLIDYLNKTTDITWGLKLQKNIEETVNALCKGDISIALLGPIPFIKAQKKCDALCKAIRELRFPEHEELTLSCSMGFATLPYNASTAEELKDRSDKALYIAKEEGRDRAIGFTPQ